MAGGARGKSSGQMQGGDGGKGEKGKAKKEDDQWAGTKRRRRGDSGRDAVLVLVISLGWLCI